jgi:hypothetical protein
MAEGDNKEVDGGVLGRLAGRGEDALTRLMDELGRNPRVTDALGRTMAAKGKVDDTTRKTLSQVGLAAAGEIKELRQQLERLEKRLSKLETSGAGTSGGAQAGRKSATATKSSGGTARKSPASPDTKSGGSASGSRSGSSSGGTAPGSTPGSSS